MTTADAARLLGVTPGTVRDAIRAGRMPATRHGRDWHVTPAAVERYRRDSLGRRGRPAGAVVRAHGYGRAPMLGRAGRPCSFCDSPAHAFRACPVARAAAQDAPAE